MIDGPIIKLGRMGIYPYGICLALGIIACFAFLLIVMTKRNFNEEAIDKMLFLGVAATGFGIFMAVVFQALFNYIANPSAGFDLSGSMTFYGGLIGGVVGFLGIWNLYVFVIAPRVKVKLLQNNMNASLSDALPFVPPAITIAHAFGRLGCTFAGCCHGEETTAWYGIWMYTNEFGHAKVVPTQLFECIFLIALTGIMILLFFKFNFKYNFSVYMIGYGVWRFIIEFFRDDDRGSFIPGLTPSQAISIVLVILGVGYMLLQFYVLNKFMKHPELQPAVDKPAVRKVIIVEGQGDVSAAANQNVVDQVIIVKGQSAEQPVVVESGAIESQTAEEQPPVQTPAEAPVQSLNEATVQAPAEAPVQTPNEAPVQSAPTAPTEGGETK